MSSSQISLTVLLLFLVCFLVFLRLHHLIGSGFIYPTLSDSAYAHLRLLFIHLLSSEQVVLRDTIARALPPSLFVAFRQPFPLPLRPASALLPLLRLQNKRLSLLFRSLLFLRSRQLFSKVCLEELMNNKDYWMKTIMSSLSAILFVLCVSSLLVPPLSLFSFDSFSFSLELAVHDTLSSSFPLVAAHSTISPSPSSPSI